MSAAESRSPPLLDVPLPSRGAVVALLVAAYALNLGMVAMADDESATSLEPMRIISTPDQGYAAPAASTATKSDTPIYTTPMTINVVPREVIVDRQALSLEQILTNVPGVQANDVTFE